MPLPAVTPETPHAGFALFYGTGSLASAAYTEDNLRADFQGITYDAACYCIDAPERMPSGATRNCSGEAVTTCWRRPGFRLPIPAPAPAPAPAQQTIDLRMTWEGTLPVLLTLLEKGTVQGRAKATSELKRLCRIADAVPALSDALRAATAHTELSTGHGVQQQPPSWAIEPNGDFDADAIAKRGRAALALLGTFHTGA
jgi:hypothetical protein